jgi:glyoxylase I family protein
MTDSRNVRSIFHININCSSLERSVSFYESLGFTVALDLGSFEGLADTSYEAMGVTGHVAHKGPVVLFLGDNLHQTRLDLMQWTAPPPPPAEPRTPQSLGVPRIALWTKDIDALYERLVQEGVEFLNPPAGPFDDRAIKSIAYLKDPDGLIVELIEFLPQGRALYSADSAG